jgi:catechol 2,3-dioxygenase-like lactoylglutathione lyase family enzyme
VTQGPTPPIEVLAADHLDLTVRDLARSTEFYAKVLGALGFRRVAHESYVAFGNAHMNVGLRPCAPAHRDAVFDRTRPGFHHLALKAKSRADVDRFHDFLVRERIPVLDPPAEYPQYGPDYYAVFLADPDGMKIELVHFPWGYWRRVQTEGRDARPRGA